MGERPLKIRLLEIFNDGQPHWNNEVVETIFKEYNMSGNYERDLINFDLIELASGGMLSDIEQKVDTEGIYKKDFLLHKYVITDFGREKAESACAQG
ncbi:hypothetical protein MmiEs2_13430 [Methanimicrococcus stummii]|uniref:Uncharacterized protein n=1 Tax=Methanimicrococcus stummii TaxID=3028294 RepID=A0AA96V9B8_9EURY|nr:hypothetical protein [Methanimicrococcus sp. Es2]WNY29127.1 hypothetical protein MmiEs2_13430 [Methanimicrococcus sp. Es2]